MKHKLALTIALASFGVITALGVGFAGAEDASQATGVGQATETAASPVAGAECANGVDDDGDGLVDAEDPGCVESSQASEGSAPAGAPQGGADIEAPDAKPGSGLETGATIHPGGNVHRNQSIGDASGGRGNGGGVTAPSATGGVQLPDTGNSGGLQYGSGGTPTGANPTATIALFGPAPIGVPNFVIDSFEIPPFLLPIYQACGTEYGIPWQVLASINKIETGFGTNMGPSSAGALGWMQFLPSSWEAFGLDANGDGRKDPYNPVDAICAAANYLDLSGGSENLYDAIFAYNHADWYVQEVLTYARAYGKLPADLVGSLTGLTEGAHFPVAADARYADDLSAREALRRGVAGAGEAYGKAAHVISSSPTRRGINIFAAEGAPVVAVNDGVIEKMGSSVQLGRFVVLRDAYGNRYTYAELGKIVREGRTVVMPTGKERRIPIDSENLRPRLRALPGRVDAEQLDAPGQEVDNVTREDGTLKVGSRVIAGTVLGRIAVAEGGIDSHVNFSIRPAGRGAPRIDPKPILDGWKLLEATAIYRAKGKSPFAQKLGSAGVLLLSKEALQRRVLADERLSIYDCGRTDIATGQIDRRVLAALEYLAEKGYRLTVTSLKCGHGFYTTSGNVSNHSYGNAVDIPVINGVPVLGNQGPGTLTDALLKEVLRFQGTMAPEELISLEDLGGPSFAMADHADHVHIGWQPPFAPGGPEPRFVQLLKADQWERLIDRLSKIDNPEVLSGPSEYALPAKPGKDAANGSGGTGGGD
jgi:transglycosylase-like protein with SLT domain/peptidase M23-like protein